MHHIQPLNSKGWTEMSNALYQFARNLLRYSKGCCGGGGSSECGCDVGLLEKTLDITRSLAEKSTDLQASIGKVISEAKRVGFG